MTPLERKAAFKATVTMLETTGAKAVKQLGVSYNHLSLVLQGKRVGSKRLRMAFAKFIDRPERDVFGSTR